MTKTIETKFSAMSDERIAELNNFKTQDFSDCPIQTTEQLQEFKPKYPKGNLISEGSRLQVVQQEITAPV